MKLYAVFQEGVYRHECGGIFTTEAKALATAKKLATGDRDSYHEYAVVPFCADEETHVTDGSYPRMVEAAAIETFRKGWDK